MTYRFIRNSKTRGLSLDLWLPLCFLVMLILFYFIYPTVLGDFASRVASPIWKGRQFLSEKLGELSFFFASKQRLTDEVRRLSSELEHAKTILIDRELLLSENKVLREQFGRATEAKARQIGAILRTPPMSLYDTAVIDVGLKDGVQIGDLALSGSAVLGVVEKVFTRTSLVEFFSTAGKKTEVTILHEAEAISVEAEGLGGGEFRATLPKGVSIFPDDPIVMPGLSLLSFATVEAVESTDTDTFQTVRFKNPVSIGSLRFLEIQKSVAQD